MDPQPPPAKSNNILTIIFAVGVPLALILACGISISLVSLTSRQGSNSLSTLPATPEPITTKESSPASSPHFAPSAVCTLPWEVAQGTRFASLDGGTWGKWGDGDGELDFGCKGGRDSIKLIDDGKVEVTTEYGAIGGPQRVHYVTAEYMAFQYAGQTSTEKQLRKEYADFCDKLSEKFYGVRLPAKLRKRLLDESTYSSSGTANEYAEKVGSGYVNLSSNSNGAKMIMLDVHFFASEAEYKLYKDE